MSEPWYWKLGFSANPFSIKPTELTNEIVGKHVEPVLERIEKGEMQFIEAPLGSGKTTMLKSIIARFGGKHRLVYCNCVKDEKINVEELLRNANWKGKLLKRLPKGMLLMVDEAQNLLPEDAQELATYMSSGNIKSLAFFGTEYERKTFPSEINNSLNGNVTALSYLTPEEAIELVRTRIGNLKLMPDYVIREIYGRSNGNPRKLLQNCEEICRKAVDLSIRELTITDVSNLLKSPEAKAKRQRRPRKQAAAPEEKPAKKVAKTRKPAKKAPRKESSISQTPTTITYSGYNLNNIRTYEEETAMMKRKPDEEISIEPEED